MMERYNLIIHNEEFRNLLEKLRVAEEDRIFCGHEITHLLDVSRIAYIMVLEKQLNISKDVVYAAGLLHDIGRVAQYEQGLEHHMESARIAKKIMAECGYEEAEIQAATEAIKSHRNEQSENVLNEILYKADKLSRNCFMCDAYTECNWAESKKNRGVM